MQDGAAAIAGIKEGSLHLAYEPPQQDIPTLTEEGLIQIKPLIATYYYPINVTNQYLKDARVRKALSLVIDRNYIVENVTKGGQNPREVGYLMPLMMWKEILEKMRAIYTIFQKKATTIILQWQNNF